MTYAKRAPRTAALGANVQCKPVHLAQYGIMANIYHGVLTDVPAPRIGLMSVGEEKEKGNQLTKETHDLLAQCDLNFVGNVEGNDVFRGTCDVTVCDGFTGNVILKLAEGTADFLFGLLTEEAQQDNWTRLGLKLVTPAVRRLTKRMDFAEYGGAPLLGVDGIVIICHGRSDAAAIKNAVGAAVRFGSQNVNARIVAALEGARGLWDNQNKGTQ